MSGKDARRAAAVKRAKQRRITFIGVGAVVATAFVVLLLFTILREDTSRVFVNAGSTVTLNEDGTFIANLPHGVRISGTFFETEIGASTTVSFVTSRGTENGNLDSEVLSIPNAWVPACAHGHGVRYILQ